MSEWTLVVSLLGALWLLRICATRAHIVADQADRIAGLELALEREKAKTVNRFRPRPLPAWVTEPVDAPKALPPASEKPAPPPELNAGSFPDTPVIDRPYDSAQTAEHPLPKPAEGLVFPRRQPRPNPRRRIVNPMRPDHELFRLRWPGQTKENAHAR